MASGARLDGERVDEIHTDLTARRGATGVDLTGVRRLPQNGGVAFMGDTKGGPFDVTGDQAREWLRLPANPNGRTSADVLKPWVNGMDLTRRPAGKWIVDFGWTMSAGDAALYEEPFRWVKEQVHPMRQKNRGQRTASTGGGTSNRVRACGGRSVACGATSPHRPWPSGCARGSGRATTPRYTPSTTFETFPFPAGLTPDVPAAEYATDPRATAVAEAARRLIELRDRWLNPPEWVDWVEEPVPGYPQRAVLCDEEAARALRKRTLTNLYNVRPQWLADAHTALDAAVADAYGWPTDISDDEVLRELMALNRDRA